MDEDQPAPDASADDLQQEIESDNWLADILSQIQNGEIQ